jgi:hypothetical protein
LVKDLAKLVSEYANSLITSEVGFAISGMARFEFTNNENSDPIHVIFMPAQKQTIRDNSLLAGTNDEQNQVYISSLKVVLTYIGAGTLKVFRIFSERIVYFSTEQDGGLFISRPIDSTLKIVPKIPTNLNVSSPPPFVDKGESTDIMVYPYYDKYETRSTKTGLLNKF